MKLGELMEEIEAVEEAEEEYEVLLQLPEHRFDDFEYTITGVRWDHQNHQVVIEIGEKDDS